jgi:hypothetical protein
LADDELGPDDRLYTPSPWLQTRRGYVSGRSGDELLAGIAISLRDGEEELANFRLIGAAPDLYEALVAVEYYLLRDMRATLAKDSFELALIENARAAIKKVRGT